MSTVTSPAPLTLAGAQDQHAVVPVTRETRPHMLIVVASPHEVAPGVLVGFWASELTHPYYEFSRVRYQVTVASPRGGRLITGQQQYSGGEVARLVVQALGVQEASSCR
jgi:hypothetical protein